MVLENERVRLVPFTVKNAEELQGIIFDDSIWEFMGHYIRNEEDLKAYVSSTVDAAKSGSAIPFLVIDKNSKTLAGCTRIGKLDLNNKRAEIGWTWYAKKYQGTGLNAAAKQLMLQYAFEELGLQRIQFGADIRNLRSQKAIEKLGARSEGVRYAHYIDSEGNVQDDVYYSIVKAQWQEMNATSSRISVL